MKIVLCVFVALCVSLVCAASETDYWGEHDYAQIDSRHGEDLTFVDVTAQAKVTSKLSSNVSTALKAQLKMLIAKLAKHSPELESVINSSKLLTIGKGDGYGDLKDILAHVDTLENKLKSRREKDATAWGKRYKECWSTIKELNKTTGDTMNRIENLDGEVKNSENSNKIDRKRISSSESSELKTVVGTGPDAVDGLTPLMKEKDDKENYYYLHKFKRDKQINVLGLAVTLVCGFRTFVSDPWCVYLKEHPEVLVNNNCVISTTSCEKDYDKAKNDWSWTTISGKVFTDYIGMDEARAKESEFACMQRAKYFYVLCNNSSANPVTAKYTRNGRKFTYPTQQYPVDADAYYKNLTDADETISTAFWKDKDVQARENTRVKADARLEAKSQDDAQKAKEAAAAAAKLAADAAEAARKKAADALKAQVAGPSPTTAAAATAAPKLELIDIGGQVSSQEHHDVRLVIGMFNSLMQSEAITEDVAEKLGGYVDILKSGAYLVASSDDEKKNLVHQLKDLREFKREEQAASDKAYYECLQNAMSTMADMNARLKAEAQYQDQLTANIDGRIADVTTLLTEVRIKWKVVYAKQAELKLTVAACEYDRDAYKNRRDIDDDELLNVLRLRSVLRVFATEEPPVCPQNCDPEGGACIWGSQYGAETKCACEFKRYGSRCQYYRCPGFTAPNTTEETLYASDENGACSNRGPCDNQTGKCSCKEAYYHGPLKACENQWCPGYQLEEEKVAASGSTYTETTYSSERSYKQSGACVGSRGVCTIATGLCTCENAYHGSYCQYKKCPASDGLLYEMTSTSSCDGHGACRDGRCFCAFPYYGSTCTYSKCPGDCNGNGTCNNATGKCSCNTGRFGRACQFIGCPENCGGAERGVCNRITGRCNCLSGFSGETCLRPTRCAEYESNWWSSFDKEGWSLCRFNTLLFGVYRNDAECDALYCLEKVHCATPCELRGTQEIVIPINNCQVMSWWKSFQEEGWNNCPTSYFLQGFFRSECNSLYCIRLAMCCDIKKAVYDTCKDVDWAMQMKKKGWADVKEHSFIAGIRRGTGHNLSNLDGAKSCGFRRQAHYDQG